jgi:hypothetical protein
VGLLGEVREAQDAHRGRRPCGISRVLETLDSAEADELREVLADRSIMHTVIASVLQARGFDVHRKTVEAHRNGGCRCER